MQAGQPKMLAKKSNIIGNFSVLLQDPQSAVLPSLQYLSILWASIMGPAKASSQP